MRTLTEIIVVVLAVNSLGGCTVTQPATGGLEERVALYYVDGGRESAGPTEMIPGAAEAAQLALKLVTKIAAQLLRHEAAKYEQSYSAQTPLTMRGAQITQPLAVRRPRLEHGGRWFLVRTVGSKDATVAGLSPTSAAQLEAELLEHATLGGGDEMTPGNEIDDLGGDLKPLLDQVMFTEGGTNTFVTFAAVGEVRPLGSDATDFDVRLLAYRYGALKAKSISKRVPISTWAGIDSRLTVSLNGPEAMPAAWGGDFSVNATFPVKFDSGKTAEWIAAPQIPDSGFQSSPIAMPATRIFTMAAKVTETSNFKKVLEKVADEVEKLGE